MNGPIPSSWSYRLLGLLRIVAAAMFLVHGTSKWFDVPAMAGMPLPVSTLPGVAGVIESVGGALMLFGFLVRPVAFVLAGEMAVAYFLQHAPHGWIPLLNKGEPAVLYCFIWLYIAAAGPGAWSIDALRMRRSRT
ncbi:MAG TPA: DoxX family protein [Gemmatimonadales bacterium]|jgi:putative oxidoreductase|nr:DoxX family protein [Gemmatimonadales bacterium]